MRALGGIGYWHIKKIGVGVSALLVVFCVIVAALWQYSCSAGSLLLGCFSATELLMLQMTQVFLREIFT